MSLRDLGECVILISEFLNFLFARSSKVKYFSTLLSAVDLSFTSLNWFFNCYRNSSSLRVIFFQIFFCRLCFELYPLATHSLWFVFFLDSFSFYFLIAAFGRMFSLSCFSGLRPAIFSMGRHTAANFVLPTLRNSFSRPSAGFRSPMSIHCSSLGFTELGPAGWMIVFI